jgi:antitoxin MazE
MLIKIGNSQGVRIPKTIIKQAHLENASLEFEVTTQGLLLKPVLKKPREGWEEQIKKALLENPDIDEDIFLGNDIDFEGWEW